MVSFAFYGWSFLLWTFQYMRTNIQKNSCYKFFAIISFALLLSSCFNLHVYFRLFFQTTIFEMPSLIRNEKVTCENCGTQTTRINNVRYKKSCSAGTLYCTHCPNSPQNPKMISITILLRSTAPQNLITPSSVNFAFQSFQDFTLYVNTETLNTECKSDQEQEMWM